MILAIGNSGNYEHEAFSSVLAVLRRMGNDARLFRQDKCLSGEYITFEIKDAKAAYSVVIDGIKHDVSEFDAIWYLKPHLPKELREHPNQEFRYFIDRQFRSLRQSIQIAFSDKRWLNDPRQMEQAENKPVQLAAAAQVGLSVPETIITSDSIAVRQFFDRVGGEAVIKLLASSPLPNRVIYTNKLDQAALRDLDRLKYAPAIVQKMVPKAYELRITIVGDQLFAARIDSQSDPETSLDWRRLPLVNDFKVVMAQHSVPFDIRAKLLDFMGALGLRFGCVDMVVTPAGEHVFLEVNPNGQWCFVQKRTGADIATAIARALLGIQ